MIPYILGYNPMGSPIGLLQLRINISVAHCARQDGKCYCIKQQQTLSFYDSQIYDAEKKEVEDKACCCERRIYTYTTRVWYDGCAQCSSTSKMGHWELFITNFTTLVRFCFVPSFEVYKDQLI